jgi:ABC-type sugar transport system ATPase subunit
VEEGTPITLYVSKTCKDEYLQWKKRQRRAYSAAFIDEFVIKSGVNSFESIYGANVIFDDDQDSHVINSYFSIENLSLVRGSFVLNDISFNLPKGKVLAVTGQKDSGKSIFLKAIAGFEVINSGSISLGGKRIENLYPLERRIGMIFEDYSLLPHHTFDKNVKTNVSNDSKINNYPDYIPEGIRQTVSAAENIISEIDLLLFDDPFTRVSESHHGEMLSIFRKLIEGLGKTAIICLSNPSDAAFIGDYTAEIINSRIVNFKKNSKTPEFFGNGKE